MFETTRRAGVLELRRPGTRWLSTGIDGGYSVADAAYSVTVPDGWSRTDPLTYAAERRRAAGFDGDEGGPTLLTGVDAAHARGATRDPVTAIATAGLSNPATLPIDSEETVADAPDRRPPGTVNVVVGTTRSLPDGALANLVAVATEAKTATLLPETGFTGTTSDAVVVACDPTGDDERFTGSATEIGAAARACVRDAVRASVKSRYGDGESIPESVADAEYGVVTDERADVFEP